MKSSIESFIIIGGLCLLWYQKECWKTLDISTNSMKSMDIQIKMDTLFLHNGQCHQDTHLHYIWMNPLNQNIIEDSSLYVNQCHQEVFPFSDQTWRNWIRKPRVEQGMSMEVNPGVDIRLRQWTIQSGSLIHHVFVNVYWVIYHGTVRTISQHYHSITSIHCQLSCQWRSWIHMAIPSIFTSSYPESMDIWSWIH